ncbi:MAG TPA: fused MFS/spermidine synthase [Fibrobacteria bacterium]|nr:fused MFS/spermidine synthase [Fibrobacteria bacterium]
MPLKRLPTQFLILFVLSGIAGLVHETVWARYLGIILGHSAYGQILTLMVYMGGIGLGSALAGKFIHRFANPLKAYVLVELGIGIGGFVFHHEFLALRGWLLDSGILVGASETSATLASVGVGVILTLPFALLIGMTYPLATSYFIRTQKDAGEDSVARLYFGNSLGAAFGAILNSYFLIPHLGTAGALMVAGGLNTGVAALAWLAHRSQKPETPAPAPAAKPAKASSATPAATAAPAPAANAVPKLLLASALVTGLSSFFYEIGWIRYLALLLGSSTHAFDLMVSAFILGLAGGAWTVHKNPHWDLTKTLIVAQICMAGAAVIGVVAYEPIFRAANELNQIFQRTPRAYPFFTFARYLFCLIVMLPASWFAGMTLPVICRHLLSNGHNESVTGKVYAWNTLGAIIGAAIAGLTLLPLIGPFRLVGLGAAIDLGLAFLLAIRLLPKRYPSIVALASVCLILVAWSLVQKPKSNIITAGIFRGYSKFRTHLSDSLVHGRTASIHVNRDHDQIVISTNGKPDASLFLTGPKPGPTDAMTQSMLGWIGRSYVTGSFRAAMIGMGSGQSANTVLQDSRCVSLDLIEIEPAVFDLARWFYPANRLVYDDPRSKVHFQDARIFFARQENPYDLIISEPSNPWVSGVASLFTDEFYVEMRRRLSNSGVLVQWFHTYETNDRIVLSILKTIRNNFDHVAVLSLPNPYDFYVVASPSPLNPKPELLGTIDSSYLQINFLARSDLGGGLEILHNEAIDLAASESPINSEFHPFVDVQAEQAFFLYTRSNFLAELDQGSISLDAIARRPVPADLFTSRARRSILARSFRLEEKFKSFQGQLSAPDLSEQEKNQIALHHFRAVVPPWTWAIPKVAKSVDAFKGRIDSMGLSSAEAALFRWSWHTNRMHHDSAASFFGRAMDTLPGDLTIDNLRDIYAYLIINNAHQKATQVRSSIEDRFPGSGDRIDLQILDRIQGRATDTQTPH